MKAGDLLSEHKKLKDKVRRLEKEVKHLEKYQKNHTGEVRSCATQKQLCVAWLS